MEITCPKLAVLMNMMQHVIANKRKRRLVKKGVNGAVYR